MPHQPEGAVVVGVDGSEKDDRAVDWAADQAKRVDRDLHVLHCIPVVADDLGMLRTLDIERLGASTTEASRARAKARHPGLTVTTESIVEDPAVALVRASGYARGIVLGASGRSRIAGRLLGSVSQKVAAHAYGPVAVIRGDASVPGGPVVVGIDPGDTVPDVLEWAFLQATMLGVGVRLVHAQRRRNTGTIDPQVARALGTAVEREAGELARVVEEWSAKYPDVSVEVDETTGHPVDALTEEASRGCVLVVGSRGRKGFIGTRLGSVARGVLQGGAPVVVVVRVAAGS